MCMTKLHPIVRRDVCAFDSAVSRRLLLAGAAALMLTRSAAAAPLAGEDPLMTLVGLMRQRLDLIVAVARSKWNTGSSVEDLAREKSLADDVAGWHRAMGSTRSLRQCSSGLRLRQQSLWKAH